MTVSTANRDTRELDFDELRNHNDTCEGHYDEPKSFLSITTKVSYSETNNRLVLLFYAILFNEVNSWSCPGDRSELHVEMLKEMKTYNPKEFDSVLSESVKRGVWESPISQEDVNKGLYRCRHEQPILDGCYKSIKEFKPEVDVDECSDTRRITEVFKASYFSIPSFLDNYTRFYQHLPENN